MSDIADTNKIGTEVIDLLTDVDDALLNIALEDGILKDIPIIKDMVAICKLAQDVPNYLFLRNLTHFLQAANKMGSKQFTAAKTKFANYKNRKKLGENILYILTHSEDEEKVKLLADTLILLNQDDISVSFYLTICFHIVNCCYSELKYIKYFENKDSIITSINPDIPEEVLNGLFANGFLYNCGFDGGDLSGTYGGTRFGLSKYGEILKQLLEN